MKKLIALLLITLVVFLAVAHSLKMEKVKKYCVIALEIVLAFTLGYTLAKIGKYILILIIILLIASWIGIVQYSLSWSDITSKLSTIVEFLKKLYTILSPLLSGILLVAFIAGVLVALFES